jgi:hypothetical protein
VGVEKEQTAYRNMSNEINHAEVYPFLERAHKRNQNEAA